MSWRRSLGRLWGALTWTLLDLDVVDTTWLQAGLPAGSPDLAVNTRLRHSHFSFNQLTVDDVAELIVHGRRAAARTSRLRQLAGNVYHFVVPSAPPRPL